MDSDSTSTDSAFSQHMANAIRALSMDAVQAANSGHPGMPMGMADVATVLFTKHLKFLPNEPRWANRDRFVLSAGHGSMLLYSTLYLLGYPDITIDDIKNFRQLNSKTAGHPEFGELSGVETTTGPLGQGIATAVGMAIAERLMATRFGDELYNHHTYVIAGDGDLMEGISQEAISLAGHLKLSKLIVLFDDNGISIDGPVSLADSTDQGARFRASGWTTFEVDGHDQSAVDTALIRAKASEGPCLIACKTQIGFGSPNKVGTSGAHGAPLGEEEIVSTRTQLDWPHPAFEIPVNILSAWRKAGERSKTDFEHWRGRMNALDEAMRTEHDRVLSGALPQGVEQAFRRYCQELANDKPKLATRKASENVLDVFTEIIPEMIGGSADLTGSNNTKTKATLPISASDFSGRFIHYGIREHAMAAAMNGMALYGGLIPYSGTFLVFTDYCRPAIRLSALMKQRVIYVMTHDSIGLGEDGPTHQPVEHLASLRAIPNLNVYRPADAMETAECWKMALETPETPSILALSRQNLPALRTSYLETNQCSLGAYEMMAAEGIAKVTLLATGSEVHLAIAAREQLQEKGYGTRVVSMPCWELFDQQPEDYKRRILGDAPVRIAIEAAVRQGWDKYLGINGAFIGMDTFGTSAPYEEAFKHFGITVDAIIDNAIKLCSKIEK